MLGSVNAMKRSSDIPQYPCEIAYAKDLSNYYAAANAKIANYVSFDNNGDIIINKDEPSSNSLFSIPKGSYTTANEAIIQTTLPQSTVRYSGVWSGKKNATIVQTTINKTSGVLTAKAYTMTSSSATTLGTATLTSGLIDTSNYTTTPTGFLRTLGGQTYWGLIVFKNGNAVLIQKASTSTITAIEISGFVSSMTTNEFNNFRYKLYGGAYGELGEYVYYAVGSTGRALKFDSTGFIGVVDIEDVEGLQFSEYYVAPLITEFASSTVLNQTKIGVCMGKIVPIDADFNPKTPLSSLPSTLKTLEPINNKIVLNSSIPCYTWQSPYDPPHGQGELYIGQYNNNTVEFSEPTISNYRCLYDVNNNKIVQEIHGWTYNSSTHKYEKNGSSVSLSGVVIEGHIIQYNSNVAAHYITYYDEDLNIFVEDTSFEHTLTYFWFDGNLLLGEKSWFLTENDQPISYINVAINNKYSGGGIVVIFLGE